MRYLLVLVWLFSSVVHADVFQGHEKEGYFYPDFQAWRVVEVRRLSPIKINPQLSGVPLMLMGSVMFFSSNYFTLKSVNSGGDLVFPACFVQDKKDTQAHILSDDGRGLIGEYFDFKPAKNGVVYLTWGGYLLLGIKQDFKFDASQRPKFEDIVEKSQNMKEQGEIITAIEQRHADKPEALAKYLPIMKKNMKTLLQKKECEFIESKKVVETKSKNLKIIFPQLHQQMIVPDGVIDLGKNINSSSSVTRHKYPLSIEYIRKDSCTSNVLFSDYTSGEKTSEKFITRGFLGGRDDAIISQKIMKTEKYKQWFSTYYQLRYLKVKVDNSYMDELFNQVSSSSCHRELYRKRINIQTVLTRFQGFQGFTDSQEYFSPRSEVWETDNLLVLETKEYKLSIHDSAPDELTISMEYPLIKP